MRADNRTRNVLRYFSGTAVLLSLFAATTVQATNRIVSNKGTDSGTCGAAATPCRSITQGITNAVAGDTIMVGPGTYGDLDGNGVLGDSPGEEVPSANAMINVTKSLTLKSRDGAGATVLDAGTLVDVVVDINAGAVVAFGKPNMAFTVRRGAIEGVLIHSGTVTLVGNVAESNGVNGFDVFPGVVGATLSGNLALLNPVNGFADQGTGTVLKGNLSRQNGQGFYFAGANAVATKNVATNNSTNGVDINVPPPGTTSPIASFHHNAIVGNPSKGLIVDLAGNFTQNVSIALDHNDYYGNGDGAFPAPLNCGVFAFMNDTNATPHNLTVTLTKDFWGAASGPGANPKDDAGAACEDAVSGSSTVNVVTPSTMEYTVLPPTIR